MADISFSLADLFEKTFGYKTKAFDPNFRAELLMEQDQRQVQGSFGSPLYADDALGMEYFMPVTITYPDVTSLPEAPEGVPFSGNENTLTLLKKWDLPYPIVSVNSRKTIVETPLTERRGTVKELINIQDYEISVKGFIIGAGNNFPENDIITLRTIYEQNAPLSIRCPITDVFLLRPGRNGSDHVVITDLKFPPVTGIKNVRPYELRMVSDEPFNLISIA